MKVSKREVFFNLWFLEIFWLLSEISIEIKTKHGNKEIESVVTVFSARNGGALMKAVAEKNEREKRVE